VLKPEPIVVSRAGGAEAAPSRSSSLPYVLPFATFFLLIYLADYLEFLGQWEFPLRVAILALVLYFFSRHVIDLRVSRPASSCILGIAVFAIWIAPDLFFPGYRTHWLFQNPITGALESSVSGDFRSSWMVLLFRSVRAIILVPVIEELFWRSWLLRWLIRPDFETVPLGTYSAQAMWISAIFFASEHGPYWDVGLVAGLLYNWWMFRTRRLGDCILAHAITNALLCVYVISAGKWEYWL
jgi:CAAX prenyl protease-like protein